MNHDTMSVHELVSKIFDEGIDEGFNGHQADDLEPLETALRSAVIREASVGVVTTYTTLDGPDGNEYMRTDWHIVGCYPQDGTFDLIPKETP